MGPCLGVRASSPPEDYVLQHFLSVHQEPSNRLLPIFSVVSKPPTRPPETYTFAEPEANSSQ